MAFEEPSIESKETKNESWEEKFSLLKDSAEKIMKEAEKLKENGYKKEVYTLRLHYIFKEKGQHFSFKNFLEEFPLEEFSSQEEEKGLQKLKKILLDGFEEGWLHFLLRAELLYNTYFIRTEEEQKNGLKKYLDEMKELGENLQQIANIFYEALDITDCDVPRIKLLDEESVLNQGETIRHAAGDLGEVSAIKSKVNKLFNEDPKAKFYVDVSSFPHTRENNRHQGTFVIADPIEF